MSHENFSIIRTKRKPKPSKVLDTYWTFAAERQEIFFKKIQHPEGPWTTDQILQKHKFTNAYRASDRVSQYLIKNVIYQGSQRFEEIFFRTMLFKIFNKIETWELLSKELNEINIAGFDFKRYNKVLLKAMASKQSIYSGAYIMASGKSAFGHEKKFQNHLCLIKKMIAEDVPDKIINATSLEDIFHILKGYPTIGSFLAYQYAIDLNYSASLYFSEMDFVEPGPGAKDGIKKCFTDCGDYTESDIIQYVTDMQEKEFIRLGVHFKSLGGRKLQLIDCQNLFCEVDKYARVRFPKINGLSNRKRIKQLYQATKDPISYWYPPKWNINEKLGREF